MKKAKNVINNIHDKFAKELFSDKELLLDFLQAYLPKELSNKLILNNLKYTSTSYITEELAETFSDMVFSVPVVGDEKKSLKVTMLLEKKSHPEPNITFQMLGYTANGYLTQIKNKEDITPIIPIVYYQGDKEWKIKTIPEILHFHPLEIQKYLPTFETIFISITSMDDNNLGLLRNSLLIAAIKVQKYRFDSLVLHQKLKQILESIEPHMTKNFLKTLFVYILEVTEINEFDLNNLVINLPLQTKSEIMSTYDQIVKRSKNEGLMQGLEQGLEQGIQKGIQQGLEKGLEKGILINQNKVIINAFQRGMDVQSIADLNEIAEDHVIAILHQQGLI